MSKHRIGVAAGAAPWISDDDYVLSTSLQYAKFDNNATNKYYQDDSKYFEIMIKHSNEKTLGDDTRKAYDIVNAWKNKYTVAQHIIQKIRNFINNPKQHDNTTTLDLCGLKLKYFPYIPIGVKLVKYDCKETSLPLFNEEYNIEFVTPRTITDDPEILILIDDDETELLIKKTN